MGILPYGPHEWIFVLIITAYLAKTARRNRRERNNQFWRDLPDRITEAERQYDDYADGAKSE